MARWRREAYLGSCLLVLAFLASCAPVQESPQGITGVWQGRFVDGATQARMKGNFWVESTSGSGISVPSESGFISGSYVGTRLTASYSNLDSVSPQIITLQADRSGNRLVNGTYEGRRASDNVLVFSGTFEADYVMHPADLKTSFPTRWSGTCDLSDPWAFAPAAPDIDVRYDAARSRYVVSAASGNANARPVSAISGSDNAFLLFANIGGDLPTQWRAEEVMERNGQIIFVKTRERKVAVLEVMDAASGMYRFSCGYGGYAVASGTRYLQRRRTAGGAERAVAYLEMKDPDTATPVDLARINPSTLEVELIPASGDARPPFGMVGSPIVWGSQFYSGTGATFVLQNGVMADVSPPGGALNSQYFVRLRANDIRGYEYFDDVYFDNNAWMAPPFVDNATMSATWDSASLRLSWAKPAGLNQATFPTARFVIFVQTRNGIDNNGDGSADLLYTTAIPINDMGGDTSVTVPANAYAYLAQYAPGDLVWQVQVRIYATPPGESASYEVYRHSSNNCVLPGRPDTIMGSYLHLRTYADGTRRYVAWGGLDGPMAWNIPFDGGTVTSISVLDNTGTPVALQAGSQRTFGGPNWQPVPGGTASAPVFGPTFLRGYNAWLDVPVGSLAAGVYTIRVVSASGTFDQPLYYPGDQILPAVARESMSGTVNDDGSVTLSWLAPPGFDNTMTFMVTLRSATQDLFPDVGFDELLYAGLGYNPSSASYSLTVPKYVADWVRGLYAAGQVNWYVQTRKSYLYNGLNANVARSYSELAAFPY